MAHTASAGVYTSRRRRFDHPAIELVAAETGRCLAVPASHIKHDPRRPNLSNGLLNTAASMLEPEGLLLQVPACVGGGYGIGDLSAPQ